MDDYLGSTSQVALQRGLGGSAGLIATHMIGNIRVGIQSTRLEGSPRDGVSGGDPKETLRSPAESAGYAPTRAVKRLSELLSGNAALETAKRNDFTNHFRTYADFVTIAANPTCLSLRFQGLVWSFLWP